MGFFDTAKDFVMKYKIGAIIGGLLAIPAVIAMAPFLGFVDAIFMGSALGFGGETVAMIVNVLIGVTAGAGVQYLLQEKLNLFN